MESEAHRRALAGLELGLLEREHAGDVRRAEEELRRVARAERLLASALLGGEEEERASHLQRLMTDVSWLRDALDDVRGRMQSAEGTPEFLLALADVLHAQGLEADAIDPLERVDQPPLSRQAVQLEVRGTFERLARLLAAIEGLAPLCRVTSLELDRAPAGEPRSAPLLRARLRVVRFWSAEP